MTRPLRRWLAPALAFLAIVDAGSSLAVQEPDLFSPSRGLFTSLADPAYRPCLYQDGSGREKAKSCKGGGTPAGREVVLASFLTYQKHLLSLGAVRRDPAIAGLIRSLDQGGWLDALAFVIAGLPTPGSTDSSQQRFLSHLKSESARIYNDQAGPAGKAGFGEDDSFDRAVRPGLELYAFQRGAAPQDRARLAQRLQPPSGAAPTFEQAVAIVDREFRGWLKASSSR